jgi:RimJ/RimL family protein N-acetyltransferase
MTTVIPTARLMLRPVTMSDAPAMARLANDFAIARMLGRVPHPYRLQHAQNFIASLASSGEIVFAIVGRDGFMGTCGIIPRGEGRDEIGYWLGRRFWGRGFAPEMAAALIAHLFEMRSTIEVLVAHCDDNVASRRLILGLGFEYVKTSDAWCAARAAHVPCLRYHLTKARWQAQMERQ